MNMEKAIRIDSNSTNKPLGCRWEISGDKLVQLSIDPFHEGTTYYYIEPSQTLKDFKSLVGGILCGDTKDLGAEEEIFDNAKVNFKCVYLPVLKCGDKVLALNSAKNDYIIKQYFGNGTMTASELGYEKKEMWEGCIDLKNVEIYPIDLSQKEIDYLASYYNIDKRNNYEVIFCPIYISELANDKQHFTATKLAVNVNTSVIYDYTMDNDSFILSLGHLLVLIVAVLLETVLITSMLNDNYSYKEALGPYVQEYFSTFLNFNDFFHKFCFDNSTIVSIFMAPVFIIVMFITIILSILVGSVIVSGIIVAPILLGVIIWRTIFVLYRIKKRNNKLKKYCFLAKINKSDIQTKIPIKVCIMDIFLSIPIVWPFVLTATVYIIVKYFL